jgi:hypothetical protein
VSQRGGDHRNDDEHHERGECARDQRHGQLNGKFSSGRLGLSSSMMASRDRQLIRDLVDGYSEAITIGEDLGERSCDGTERASDPVERGTEALAGVHGHEHRAKRLAHG